MKAPRGKLSLSIITFVVCALAFSFLLYNESLSSVSSSFGKCSRKRAASLLTSNINAGKANPIDEVDDVTQEYKFDFDPDICDITDGKWVYNRSIEPLYTDRSCPYLDRQVSCVKNGRNDSGYRYWHWQPDECTLPRFDPKLALRKLKGKRLMFVGDSLIRGQWQSFVCLIESVIPEGEKSLQRGKMHTIFRAKRNTEHFFCIVCLRMGNFGGQEYNATVEFYWAPFLVESNSDEKIIGDTKQRILKVDSVAKHAKNWGDVDILVFGTYVWWMSGWNLKTLWGSFGNGEEGYEELETPVAYRIGLKTWANWVDSNVDVNKTRVFFTTMSPTHTRVYASINSRLHESKDLHVSEDWNRKNGLRCYNETKPIGKKGHWGTGSDKRIMDVVRDVLGKIKRVPVTVLNVTQISEYRVDGHASVYTETGGKLLTEEQKADPLHNADCIHWCLPGVPDTWNQIFFAYL
ncbi:hypothetical protein V2J09_018572 [Rumex salicifolius]